MRAAPGRNRPARAPSLAAGRSGSAAACNRRTRRRTPISTTPTWSALAYCSSDFWSGGTSGDPAYPADDVRSWHFQGRAIVLAVLRDLVARHGLGPGQEVLFGGASAGGVGMFLTLNDAAPLLGATRLLAASDGGYGIDVAGINGPGPGGATPIEAFVAQAMALWRGRGDGPCTARATAAQPGNERARMECYSPEVLTHGGGLPTPVFIRQSEQDRMLLRTSGFRPGAAGAEAYLRRFGADMVRALSTVDPWHSVFATAGSDHVAMDGPAFTEGNATFPGPAGVFGTSIARAFGDWYRRPCPATRDVQPPT